MEAITNRAASSAVDICITCNHMNECLSSMGNGHAIWFCDLFDDNDLKQHAINFTPPKSVVNNKDNHRFMGLCVNCDNRNSCLNSATPGGIWHCEEYM